MRRGRYCPRPDLWRFWELRGERSRIYSPDLTFSAISAASPESFVLMIVCPFMTVIWSPETVATMGSELSFAAGFFLVGCSSGRGILPMRAVAPAATAATPTPYFRNSLRDTMRDSCSESDFSSVLLFVKMISVRHGLDRFLTV